MYFSFIRIYLTPFLCHAISSDILFSSSQITFRPFPLRYALNIFCTISACFLSMVKFPFSLLYPYGRHETSYVPFFILLWIDHCIFCEIDTDSSCARPPIIVIISSFEIFAVSRFSFSKNTVIPRSFSSRITVRHSFVFRANREIDFAIMRSILPFLQSLSIR